jgi:hypothetical protein
MEVIKIYDNGLMEKPELAWTVRFEIKRGDKVVGRLFTEGLVELAILFLEYECNATVFEFNGRLYSRSSDGVCELII